jgi:intein/homing endonuclease
MRIRLESGKQKELILLAKEKLTWEDLAKKLNMGTVYLAAELKNEKRLLSEENYKSLCRISNSNFDRYILERVDDNWGRSKGGKNSNGNTKKFVEPKKDEKLAELFGIILGDGHIEERVIGTKIRVYCLNIAGNSKTDSDYIFRYIPSLSKEIFKEEGIIRKKPKVNCAYFSLHGKKIVEFLKKNGLKPGNKVKNNVGIPQWIKESDIFLKKCIRGLTDTDGCVYYISKKTNRNIRITFTNHSSRLLADYREGLIKLGFYPSKIMRGYDVYLSSKQDVDKYLKEIGFSNSKNLKRVKFLSKHI